MSNNWNQNTQKLLALKKKKFKPKSAASKQPQDESSPTPPQVSIDLLPKKKESREIDDSPSKRDGDPNIGNFELNLAGNRQYQGSEGKAILSNGKSSNRDFQHGKSQQIFEYSDQNAQKRGYIDEMAEDFDQLQNKRQEMKVDQQPRRRSDAVANQPNELSDIVNSKHSEEDLQMDQFLDDDDEDDQQLKYDFFGKNDMNNQNKDDHDQNKNMNTNHDHISTDLQIPGNGRLKTLPNDVDNYMIDQDSAAKLQSSEQKLIRGIKLNNNYMLTSTNIESNMGLGINTKDVFFLMERYKEDNNGQVTTDICQLFSYWHTNYHPNSMQNTINLKSTIHEDKTLINYNSKSFNNKTYVNHENKHHKERQISLDVSPIANVYPEEQFNLDQIGPNSIEEEDQQLAGRKSIYYSNHGKNPKKQKAQLDNMKASNNPNSLEEFDFGFNAQNEKITNQFDFNKQSQIEDFKENDNQKKINEQVQMQISQISLRKNSDPRQVDSILYSQKLKIDSEKNINEIQLGNVKNQVLNAKKNPNANLSQLSQLSGGIGGGVGREIDRNQLSIEFMNITPIMEEKENNIQQVDDKDLSNEPKQEDEEEEEFCPPEEIKQNYNCMMDEQFSFDQDLNFNPEQQQRDDEQHASNSRNRLSNPSKETDKFGNVAEMDLDEKLLVDDLEQLEQRISKQGQQKQLKNAERNQLRDKDQLSFNLFATNQFLNANYMADAPNTAVSFQIKQKIILAQSKYLETQRVFQASFKYYYNEIQQQKILQMLIRNQQILNACNNMELVYDLKSSERSNQMESQIYRNLQNHSPMFNNRSYPRRQNRLNYLRNLLKQSIINQVIQNQTQLLKLQCLNPMRNWIANMILHKPMEDQKLLVIQWLQRQLAQFSSQGEMNRDSGREDSHVAPDPVGPVGFDHLSSIDSGDNNDDNIDAGEVLQALKGTTSPKSHMMIGSLASENQQAKQIDSIFGGKDQNKEGVQMLKNDDDQYKIREMKNLQKFRDLSKASNKSSDVHCLGQFKGIKNEQDDIAQNYEKFKSDRKSRHDRRRHGHKSKDRSQNKHNDQKSHKDKNKRRKKSKFGGDSSQKSKSKSRFSNNLGFTQLQNAIQNDADCLENTQDIEKLLQEIDNDKNELDQFISKEEENFSKKFNNKVSEAEKELQYSRRDGSMNRGPDSFRANNYLGASGNVSKGLGLAENLQQNQHHNSISNNSNSFYFNLTKKVNVNQKSSNNSMSQNHPYNPVGSSKPGCMSSNQGKNYTSVKKDTEGDGSSSSSKSSSQQSRSMSDNGGGDNRIFKNASNRNTSHQIYSQTSQLLTDRPNHSKRLDLGKIRSSIHNKFPGGAGGDKSNERQVSIVSGNSNKNLNFSNTNRQRYLFSNNNINNQSAISASGQNQHKLIAQQQQYSSLSRMGLMKISSGMSNGAYSNQSPSNQNANFLSQQKLTAASAVKNSIHNASSNNFNGTQNSYRTLNQQNNQNQNPILLKLQSTQQSRAAAGPHNGVGAGIGSSSIMLCTADYPSALTHRANPTSSINSIITPKSLAGGVSNALKKGTASNNTNGGGKYSLLNTANKNSSQNLQPILRQINLEQANKRGKLETEEMKKQAQELDSQQHNTLEVRDFSEQNQLTMPTIQTTENDTIEDKYLEDQTHHNQDNSQNKIGGQQQKQILSIKMVKGSKRTGESQNDGGPQSTRLYTAIGSFTQSQQAQKTNKSQQQNKMNIKSNRGVGGADLGNSASNANLNASNGKLSDRFRNSSNSSAGSPSQLSQSGRLKLKLKPRNFKQANPAPGTTQQDKSFENTKEKRRDRLSRGMARSGQQNPASITQISVQQIKTQNVHNQTHDQSKSGGGAVQNRIKQTQSSFHQYNNQGKGLSTKEQQQPPKKSMPEQQRYGGNNISYQQQASPNNPSHSFTYTAGKNEIRNSEEHHYYASELNKNQGNMAGYNQARTDRYEENDKQDAEEHAGAELADRDRLIELLINEFKRKKNKIIQKIDPQDQLKTLIYFWRESLARPRILHKLTLKSQGQSVQNQQSMVTNKSINNSSKLSDKERWLLAYLQGTDTTQLMKLGKDSTTRNYGELACMSELALSKEICRHLNLEYSEVYESRQSATMGATQTGQSLYGQSSFNSMMMNSQVGNPTGSTGHHTHQMSTSKTSKGETEATRTKTMSFSQQNRPGSKPVTPAPPNQEHQNLYGLSQNKQAAIMDGSATVQPTSQRHTTGMIQNQQQFAQSSRSTHTYNTLYQNNHQSKSTGGAGGIQNHQARPSQ